MKKIMRRWEVLLLAFCATAVVADTKHIRAIEDAFEVGLSAVNFPDRPDGQVILAPCPGCAPRSLRLSIDTQLQWNGAKISLLDLRKRSLRGSAGFATIIYNRESGRIVRISGNG